ncbi:probable DNA-directed RNA polymerase I subunit RPA43 [Anopheles ziemanni]|uniref:probable DNA-directed RNA polymerase I subunit RPA43 n=1 Tax=Anopheles coustani TaxID=139045 RepID=UPI002658F4BC|nr:probable DNA-directed RNA polymerase I subunit RPA43 [Anopheles coustani]XP_058170732.1 probable DNA-directed RNA polymerase I subunit RPA43 [Anopheles ziemanni]
MHRTTIAKVTKFSADELKQSANDGVSCVTEVQSNEILSLRPRDCEHIVKGVRRCVMDKVGRYHSKVHGIVLGYAKIRVENTLSAFRTDSPFLHVRATIDYFVFQPRIGSTLRGTVNYVSKEFVSAMIYQVFNVTVKLNGYSKKHGTIIKGSEISFIINACDMKSEIPIIDGELVHTVSAPAVRIKEEPSTASDDANEDSEPDNTTDKGDLHNGMIEVKQEGKPKKSKRTKDAVNCDTSSSAENGHVEQDPMIEEGHLPYDTTKVKIEGSEKKSKKSKRKQNESEETNNSTVVEDDAPKNGDHRSPEPDKDELIQSLFDDMFGNLDEEPSASKKQKNKSKKESNSRKEQTRNGVTLETSDLVDAEKSVSNETPHGKKRKIRFDLNDTITYIKSEPTEEKKRKINK